MSPLRTARGAPSRSAGRLGPIQIVVTPRSGNGQAGVLANALRDALGKRRCRTRLAVFDDLESLRRWAKTGANGCSLLVCVGGDGTQSATAMAAVRRSVPFLPVTSGFGNLFAQAVGAPRSVEEALGVLTTGRIVDADCGVRNGELFLCHQSYGFIADVQEAVESGAAAPRARWRRWLAYYRTALHQLGEGDSPTRYRVAVDGRLVAGDAALVIVANVQAYGAWLPLTPDASPVDGLFDVFLLRAATHGQVVAGLLRRHLRIPDAGPDMIVCRGRRVTVSSPGSRRDRLDVMQGRLPIVVSPEAAAALGRQGSQGVTLAGPPAVEA
jgi:diacylglycerol kinase (ATP)